MKMEFNIKKAINDSEDKWGPYILLDNLFSEVSKQKITKARFNEEIKKLEDEGFIVELKEGCYQRKRKVLDVEKEKYLSDLKFLFQAIKKDKNDLIVQFVPNPIEDIKKSVTDFLNKQFIKGKISEKEFEDIMGWGPDPYLYSAKIDYKHEETVRKRGLNKDV